jgi:4-alpha-glucanotransferase
VSEYAASKRVVLKGDLPIGVDKRSVDTWMEVRGREWSVSFIFCLFC